MIDWDSPTWGHPDTCVHVAENGSHVRDKHDIADDASAVTE